MLVIACEATFDPIKLIRKKHKSILLSFLFVQGSDQGHGSATDQQHDRCPQQVRLQFVRPGVAGVSQDTRPSRELPSTFRLLLLVRELR